MGLEKVHFIIYNVLETEKTADILYFIKIILFSVIHYYRYKKYYKVFVDFCCFLSIIVIELA